MHVYVGFNFFFQLFYILNILKAFNRSFYIIQIEIKAVFFFQFPRILILRVIRTCFNRYKCQLLHLVKHILRINENLIKLKFIALFLNSREIHFLILLIIFNFYFAYIYRIWQLKSKGFLTKYINELSSLKIIVNQLLFHYKFIESFKVVLQLSII